MNVLREFRKLNKKDVKRKSIFLSLFTIVFIINTYAWFNVSRKIELGSIKGKVSNFDIAYVVSNKEVLAQEINFSIDEIYPRMPIYEQNVHVYNTGSGGATIGVEVNWIKLFGQDITKLLKEKSQIEKTENTTIVFADFKNNIEYPFKLKCTIDRTYLPNAYEYGEYTPDGYVDLKHNGKYGYETGNPAVATVKIEFIWEGNNDTLDTQFGKSAFNFYKNTANSETKAIEASFKLNGKSSG